MELKKIEHSNIYEFKSSDKLTSEETEKMSQAFKEFKSNGEKIKLLGIIEEIPLPDWDSLGDLASIKLNSINVVEKYAVLTDKKWIDNWVPIGNFISPGIDVKSFALEAYEEAIEWLQSSSEIEEPVEAKDYLSNIPITKISNTAYEIHIVEKTINHGAMSAIYDIVSEANDEKINLLMTLDAFPSFDSFKTFVEGIKIDLKAMGRMGKFAVVSDAGWIDNYAKIGDFLTPGLEMKAFSKDELESARTWITA